MPLQTSPRRVNARCQISCADALAWGRRERAAGRRPTFRIVSTPWRERLHIAFIANAMLVPGHEPSVAVRLSQLSEDAAAAQRLREQLTLEGFRVRRI